MAFAIKYVVIYGYVLVITTVAVYSRNIVFGTISRLGIRRHLVTLTQRGIHLSPYISVHIEEDNNF